MPSQAIFPRPGEEFRVNRLIDRLPRIAEVAYRDRWPEDVHRLAVQYAAVILQHERNREVRDWSPDALVGQTVYVPSLEEVQAAILAGVEPAPIPVAPPREPLQLPAHPADLESHRFFAALFRRVRALQRHLAESSNAQVDRWRRIVAAGDVLDAFAKAKFGLEGQSGQTWRDIFDPDVYDIHFVQRDKYSNPEIDRAAASVAAWERRREELAAGVVSELRAAGLYQHSWLWREIEDLLERAEPSTNEWLLGWLGVAFQLLGTTEAGARYLREDAQGALSRMSDVQAGRPDVEVTSCDLLLDRLLGQASAWVETQSERLERIGYIEQVIGLFQTLEVTNPVGRTTRSAEGAALKVRWRHYVSAINLFLQRAQVGLRVELARFYLLTDEKLQALVNDATRSEDVRDLASRTFAWRQKLRQIEELDIEVAYVEAPGRLEVAGLVLEAALAPLTTMMAVRQLATATNARERVAGWVALLSGIGDIVSAAVSVCEAHERSRLARSRLGRQGLLKADSPAAEGALKPFEQTAARIGIVLAALEVVGASYAWYQARGARHRENHELLAATVGLAGSVITLSLALEWFPPASAALKVAGAVIWLVGAALALVTMVWDRVFENEATRRMREELAGLEALFQQTPWYRPRDRSKVPFRPSLWFEESLAPSGDKCLVLVAQTLYPFGPDFDRGEADATIGFNRIAALFPSLQLWGSPRRVFYGTLVARFGSGDRKELWEVGALLGEKQVESCRTVGYERPEGSKLIVDFGKIRPERDAEAVTLVWNGRMWGNVPRFKLPSQLPDGCTRPEGALAFEARLYSYYTFQQGFFDREDLGAHVAATSEWLDTTRREEPLKGTPQEEPFDPFLCGRIAAREPQPDRRASWQSAAPRIQLRKDRGCLVLTIDQIPASLEGTWLAIKLFDHDSVSGDDEIKMTNDAGQPVENFWRRQVAKYRDEDGKDYGRIDEIADVADWRFVDWGGAWGFGSPEVFVVIYQLYLERDRPAAVDEVFRDVNQRWAVPLNRRRKPDLELFSSRPPQWWMALRQEDDAVVLRVTSIPADWVGKAVRVKLFDWDATSNDELQIRGDTNYWTRTVERGGRFVIDDIARYSYHGWYLGAWGIQNEYEIDLMVRIYDESDNLLWDSWANNKQWWRLEMGEDGNSRFEKIKTVTVGD